MSASVRLGAVTARTSSPDARLVADCLRGDQHAWEALIERYQNLIYSIPLKQGLSRDEAAEIFQAVCVSLLSELPRLRDPQALPAWLMRVTSNRCARWKRQQQAWVEWDEQSGAAGEAAPAPEENIHQAALEHTLRQALAEMPPRCRQLLTMLFFETPARPYEAIAQSLGLARGSIGLTRSRCLARLRKKLEQAGFVEP